MLNGEKSVKLCIILTDIFLALLAAIVIFLPFGVSWYVEVNGRSPSLPATIMVTCYPCAPFLGIALFSLRKILKRVQSGVVFDEKNTRSIRRITLTCLAISVITLIAGRFYLPFYIVGGTFAFLALITYALKAVFTELYEKHHEADTNNNA